MNKFLVVSKTAKKTEIMMAYFLRKKVFKDTLLFVGDEHGKYPDIKNANGTMGIEVVQAEQAEDFAANLIWKKHEEFRGDASKLKHYIKHKLSHYEVKLFVKDGKVEAFSTNDLGHSAYYSKILFFTIINKKLDKLNDGRYEAINGEINLAILSIYRARSEKHVREILKEYQKIKGYYRKNFNNIYVLFTDALYEIKENKITKHEITAEDLEELKTKFNFVAHGKN